MSWPKILSWFFISIAILLAITTTLSTNPFNFEYLLYSVQSGSMKPTIYPGDMIIISTESNYAVGDIITFNDGQENGRTKVVTHRIIEKDGETFTTKGDFNSVADITKVRTESIIGKYLFRIPLLGYPVSFAKTVPGFVLLIVIPLTIVIYEEIMKIKNEIQKKREKNSQ